MKANLIRRKERRLEEQIELKTLCEEMLVTADKEDVPVLQRQLEECHQIIQALLGELKQLKN